MRDETISSWVKFLALPLFGTLLTGAFTWLQNQREIRETNVRIYAELMSETFEIDDTFLVGFFDFPMVDNTRLSRGDRCAIMLNEAHVRDGFVKATLTYFPGSRASLKDKPYYDEVIEQLLREPGESKLRDKEPAQAPSQIKTR